MNAVWIKSKWTKADLDHKSVEFRFPIDPGIATGVGEFWVRENPEAVSYTHLKDFLGSVTVTP